MKNWGINQINTNYSAKKLITQIIKNGLNIKIVTNRYNPVDLSIPELKKGKIKKKFRERPTREFTVSELIAHTGSPCSNMKS